MGDENVSVVFGWRLQKGLDFEKNLMFPKFWEKIRAPIGVCVETVFYPFF